MIRKVLRIAGWWFLLFDAQTSQLQRVPAVGAFPSWVACEESAAWTARIDSGRFLPSPCVEERS